MLDKRHLIPFLPVFKGPEQQRIRQLKGGGHLHLNLATVGYFLHDSHFSCGFYPRQLNHWPLQYSYQPRHRLFPLKPIKAALLRQMEAWSNNYTHLVLTSSYFGVVHKMLRSVVQTCWSAVISYILYRVSYIKVNSSLKIPIYLNNPLFTSLHISKKSNVIILNIYLFFPPISLSK